MMSEKLHGPLATKESELLSLLSEMQKVKLQFINDTSQFTAKWYEDTAKQYITKYSDVSSKLPTQSFVDLKAKVRRSVADSKKISERALSQPGIWWHEKPDLHTEVTQYDHLGNQQVGNKYSELIDRAVRVALGELGIILEEFGFNVRTTVTYGPHHQEYWFQRSEEKTTSPFFPHVFEWSKPMQETLQEYNLLYKRALLILQEIQSIKDEIERRKIIDLWDSTP
jgi:hypothetical protein